MSKAITPEEKAKELVDKFNYYAEYEKNGNGRNRTSKQCALIAVEEMLKTNWINVWEKDYWQEVKQEIEKFY